MKTKTAPGTLRGATTRRRCLELRAAGRTFAAIGAELGIRRQTAFEHVQRGLADLREASAEAADGLRTLELERLDELHAAVWPAARAGNVAAVDRVLRIMERRARLVGLDAPARAEVAGGRWDLSRLADDELAGLEALAGRARS